MFPSRCVACSLPDRGGDFEGDDAPAMTCMSGPPCWPGNTAGSGFLAYSCLARMKPERGPPRVLCAVEDTTSAYGTGLGCSPAAMRPAKWAMSTQNGADLVGDLLHGFEGLRCAGRRSIRDDHGGMGFERTLADDFRVDAEGFGIHAVKRWRSGRKVDFHTMGEVAAVVEGEAEDRSRAGFDERLVDGCVGLCAGAAVRWRIRRRIGFWRVRGRWFRFLSTCSQPPW